MKSFVSCHSHPQSLDSGSTPEAFLERELELDTGALVATDHGTLAACRKIYDLTRDKKACKGKKVTPILGVEGYLRDDDCPILSANGYPKNANGAFIGAPKYMHFCAHAIDQSGYECMVRLLSKADERLEETLAKLEAKDRKHGQERKPLFTWADMEELGSHNVTMTTGCMIGVVQRHLLDNSDVKTAEAYFQRMMSVVKPGNLYVELNPHDTSKNWVQGIFLTAVTGEKLEFYKDKVLLTDAGEITAERLAKDWHTGRHHILKSVKDRSTWREMPEMPLAEVKHVEDFLQNECKPWAPDGDLQKGLNRAMRMWAKKYRIPLLVGDDSHYAHADEKIVQDVRLSQGGSWRFYGSYHRKSSEEALDHFRHTLGTTEAEFEGWVDNSYAWKDRFKDFAFTSEVSLPTKFYEPQYCDHPWHQNPKIPERDHSLMYTMELIKKHGRMDWSNAAYKDRLQAEIKLLHNNGTIDLLPYFFIGEEANEVYAKAGYLTGPGRGSAAGLLLSYLLEITHVDPLEYDLSLDRFLTLDRINSGKLPDVDMDFPFRELLTDPETGWLAKRFGDHYAQLSVDTTLKLKSAVKDVARMLHKDDRDVGAFIESCSRNFVMPPMGIQDYDFVMGYEADGAHVQGTSEPGHGASDPALLEYIRRLPGDWEVVQKCLGLARQKGRHACSFVIANKAIHSWIPLTTVGGYRVTAYTAPSVEAVGGLKIDFLTVNALNDIGDCVKLVQSRSGREIPSEIKISGRRVPGHRLVPMGEALHDIWKLPADPGVFADIATSKTETVFQFGTPGARQWMRHFGHKREDGSYAIDSIMALATFTALDRPGPLDMLVLDPDGDGRSRHNMLVEYARRARGADPSPEIPAIMDELVPETLGVLCFQESLQRAYQKLTGCTGPEAEEFRSNVAKKKKEKVDAARAFFIPRATEKVGADNAEAIWQSMCTFGQYGFNASHAVCYSVIGYACAYLKHHYPLEWWTSVLKNAAKNEVNEEFWRYCGHLIDLPDVMKSGVSFEIQGDRIRAPLSLLKGVGEKAHQQLELGHPYTSIEDFVRKQEQYQIATGTTVEKLAKVKYRVPDPSGAVKKNGEAKLVTEVREELVQKFKKGHTNLNRGVISTLILSGAMDSLFPEEIDGVPTSMSDRLGMFERALADVRTDMGPVLTTGRNKGQKKQIKAEAVDPKFLNLSALQQFQLKKTILPAYGANICQLLMEMSWPGIVMKEVDDEEGGMKPHFKWLPPNSERYHDLRIASADDLRYLRTVPMAPGTKIYAAVAAYTVSWGLFRYGEERKQACKLLIDVEGERWEFVRWPGKDGDVPENFKHDLTGSIAIVCLAKFKEEKPFAIDDIVVLQREFDSSAPSEVEEPDDTDTGDTSEAA